MKSFNVLSLSQESQDGGHSFFSLLNIAGITAYQVYKTNKESSLERNSFLKILLKELLHDYTRIRNNIKTSTKNNIPTTIRLRLCEVLDIPFKAEAVVVPFKQVAGEEQKIHGRCSFYDR